MCKTTRTLRSFNIGCQEYCSPVLGYFDSLPSGNCCTFTAMNQLPGGLCCIFTFPNGRKCALCSADEGGWVHWVGGRERMVVGTKVLYQRCVVIVNISTVSISELSRFATHYVNVSIN